MHIVAEEAEQQRSASAEEQCERVELLEPGELSILTEEGEGKEEDARARRTIRRAEREPLWSLLQKKTGDAKLERRWTIQYDVPAKN